MSPKNNHSSNRQVKASAFSAYFGEPENAAKLFEALSPGTKIRPEDIDFTTLEGVLFLARKNDLAFTVQQKILVISEHQSTLNLNMPLRDAIYYGRTMEKIINPKALYRFKRIAIPTPEFYIFYNGDAPCPPEHILQLSDSFLEQTPNPMLQLTVKILNINLPENHPILDTCRPLYEYSWFIEHVKEYLRVGMERDEAIIQAIHDCRGADIMVDFLAKHGSEAVNTFRRTQRGGVSAMLFTEFNMEEALEVRYEEGREDGLEEGLKKGRKSILKELALKKRAQGKSIEEIAVELETVVDAIIEVLE